MNKFQLKRGTLANLPSSLDEGDHYLAIDQDPPQLYVGPQGGGSPESIVGTKDIQVQTITAGANAVFTEAIQRDDLGSDEVVFGDASQGEVEISFIKDITKVEAASTIIHSSMNLTFEVNVSQSGNGTLAVRAFDDQQQRADLSQSPSGTFTFYLEV
jgi:hypothetical protein